MFLKHERGLIGAKRLMGGMPADEAARLSSASSSRRSAVSPYCSNAALASFRTSRIPSIRSNPGRNDGLLIVPIA